MEFFILAELPELDKTPTPQRVFRVSQAKLIEKQLFSRADIPGDAIS